MGLWTGVEKGLLNSQLWVEAINNPIMHDINIVLLGFMVIKVRNRFYINRLKQIIRNLSL